MFHSSLDTSQPKGWFVGPWNSNIPIPIGYANAGINEKHSHAQMYEIYLIAKGRSLAVVADRHIRLNAGDVLVVEPGETHIFVENSNDYLHFVIQCPFVDKDKILIE